MAVVRGQRPVGLRNLASGTFFGPQDRHTSEDFRQSKPRRGSNALRRHVVGPAELQDRSTGAAALDDISRFVPSDERFGKPRAGRLARRLSH